MDLSDTTFFSVTSGSSDATFLTCVSGSSTVFNESQELDDDNFSETTSPNEQNKDFEFEEEKEEEDTLEASMAPLEDTIIHVVDEDEEQQFDDMMSRVIAYTEERCNFMMNSTDALKSMTTLVENETKDVISERDQALMDLRAVEQAFSDVHRKYERAKIVLENLKGNEEHLMQRDEEFQLLIASRDEKREAFKQEMEQTLEKMYSDFSVKLDAVESDNSRLTVLHRRADMRVETLQAELAHKQRENAQLNVLADDLIGKSANLK